MVPTPQNPHQGRTNPPNMSCLYAAPAEPQRIYVQVNVVYAVTHVLENGEVADGGGEGKSIRGEGGAQ